MQRIGASKQESREVSTLRGPLYKKAPAPLAECGRGPATRDAQGRSILSKRDSPVQRIMHSPAEVDWGICCQVEKRMGINWDKLPSFRRHISAKQRGKDAMTKVSVNICVL